MTLALMITLALSLGGCSGERVNEVQNFREKVLAAPEISVRAKITADYTDSALTYEVRYTGSPKEGVIEVLSPGLIAGITATYSGEITQIQYDGLVLDTGTLGDSELTPAGAIPAVLSSAAEGHIETVWSEDEDDKAYFVADITVTDDISQRLWLSEETGEPVRAEIYSGGRSVLTCDILEWSLG